MIYDTLDSQSYLFPNILELHIVQQNNLQFCILHLFQSFQFQGIYFKFSHTIFSLKLKDPTWSASLRGVLGSVTFIIFVLGKKSTFRCNFLHFISKIFRIIRNKLPFLFLRHLIYSPCSIHYFQTNDNSPIGYR